MAVGVAATLSPLAVSASLLAPVMAPASVELTVVEETCREPDDLLPLEDPAETKKKKCRVNADL